MDFFRKAKSVKLKSHHNKYLTAADGHAVAQDRSSSSTSAVWTVELAAKSEKSNIILLKSRFGKYLTASDEEFLLGMTGRKVVQTAPARPDSSVEWEPVRDGMRVKLKTRYGNFLRANGGLPPWRNSVTHDVPHRHHDWTYWEVEVVEVREELAAEDSRLDAVEEEELGGSEFRIRLPSIESNSALEDSPKKYEGRLIHYNVVDDDGNVDETNEWPCFQLKGHGLEELIQKLEEETGLEDIIVCSRNSINGKLYPLRLALPPNNAAMHVVVIPSTSRVANDFMPAAPAT